VIKINELHSRIKDYMRDRPEYRKGNLDYVRSQLKYLPQEEVIDMLKEMSLDELRYTQGAGIPGHAYLIGMELIEQRKKERKDHMSKEKVERIEETDVERELMLTTAPSLNPPAPHSEPKQSKKTSKVKISVDEQDKWQDPDVEVTDDETDDA
jgi:hypothetical protein